MSKNLPLAEKTNIKDWPFEDLLLTPVSAPTVSPTDLKDLPEQTILIVDGHVLFEDIDPNITIEFTTSPHEPAENKLIALNNEKKNAILKLTVAKNAVVMEPLTIWVVTQECSLVYSCEVVLEQGAHLEIIERFIGRRPLNANIVNQIKVNKNANFISSTISELHANTVAYHHKNTIVEADAFVSSTNFIINDTNLVFEDLTYLSGRGAEAETKTVAIASGKQKQNLTIRIENIAPRTNGNIINYGITKDEAHLAFNGIGKIQKDAKNCDNQQETRLLNLSKTAQAVANPFLLIDEGDITAGHAASIGQLDEEQIYYLMSRGMNRQEASKMIVSGFLTPFVDALDDEKVREELAARIATKIG